MNNQTDPCPFCGGLFTSEYATDIGWQRACSCGARGPAENTREGAITAWNRTDGRPGQPDPCSQCGWYYELGRRDERSTLERRLDLDRQFEALSLLARELIWLPRSTYQEAKNQEAMALRRIKRILEARPCTASTTKV